MSTNSDNKSQGTLGDVKYSVLPPGKFIEENGKGWVLMDDKILLAGSDLLVKHGITELPDARGMFIRGLNLKRADDKADPFFKETTKERLMGEFQADEFKAHDHGGIWGGTEHKAGMRDDYAYHTQGHVQIKTEGGLETRPKNIALYIYIKIND